VTSLELILFGWVGAALVMAAVWEMQRRTSNAGVVDVVWSIGVGLLAGWFAWGADGLPERRLLVAILAAAWAARLARHLIARMSSEREDGRYRQLREQWGDRTQRNLFWFFQVQAAWSVLFALPMLIACRNQEQLGALDGAGAAVWLLALAGEAAADRQLRNFKADPANRGKVLQRGLWRYSRHPNYFFEWLHWWAYVFIGWHAPEGWLTLAGPAVMLLFLTRVTGIPPTEANALRSRGEAYREYQRTTSALFPWPPKETKA
jgi:steroid 5-alpha reductase family enzyme